MSKYILPIAVGIIFLLWLVVLLPGWVLGMMFAGKVMLYPDAPMDADFWAFVASLYLPPILAAVTLFRFVKAKRKDRNA